MAGSRPTRHVHGPRTHGARRTVISMPTRPSTYMDMLTRCSMRTAPAGSETSAFPCPRATGFDTICTASATLDLDGQRVPLVQSNHTTTHGEPQHGNRGSRPSCHQRKQRVPGAAASPANNSSPQLQASCNRSQSHCYMPFLTANHHAGQWNDRNDRIRLGACR